MPAFSFPLLGEPVSLDLVNTRVRSGGSEVDLLTEPTALDTWLQLQEKRLVWSGAASPALLQEVCRLRDAIAALLAARRARTRPPRRAAATLNRALGAPPESRRLIWTAEGPRVETTPRGSRTERLLCTIAADALALLTGPDADLVRICEHPDCVLQFVARNKNRRWCTATGCGNRARVARHYSRNRATPR